MLRNARIVIGATALAAILSGLTALPAQAHKAKHKSIELTHPWVRALPQGGTVTAGYAKITNKGKEADRLIGASIEGAGSAEIHETVTEDGVSKMRRATSGIAIPAGETVVLATGGVHIMFLDVAKSLDEETYVPGSLTFEKAGKMSMEFYVEPLAGGAAAGAASAGDGHH